MRLVIITLAVLLVLGCGREATVEEPPLDPEIAALIHDLVEGTDLEKRQAAHDKLPSYGAVIVQPLAAALDREDVDDGVGAWIAEVLAVLGERAEPAAPALLRRLMKGGECAATTSHALEMMGAKGVPFLMQAITGEHAKTRLWAADALYDLEDVAAPAVDALLTAVDDRHVEVRRTVVQALGQHPDQGARIVAPLLEASRDEDEEVRIAALESALSVGPTDSDVQVRAREVVLDRSEEADARTRLFELLQEHLRPDTDSQTFLRAVAALEGDDEDELADAARALLKEWEPK